MGSDRGVSQTSVPSHGLLEKVTLKKKEIYEEGADKSLAL
jgi:hypothetical protein